MKTNNYFIGNTIYTGLIVASSLSSLSAQSSLFSELGDLSTYTTAFPTEKLIYQVPSANKYSWEQADLTNITSKISKHLNDFEIVKNFAAKMLTDIPMIDEEIQQVINDNFWDML